MSNQKQKTWINRVTNAPESYDGFGTQTVEWLDYLTRNKRSRLRKVRIDLHHRDWQESRYSSGLQSCMTVEDFEQYKDSIFVYEPLVAVAGKAESDRDSY